MNQFRSMVNFFIGIGDALQIESLNTWLYELFSDQYPVLPFNGIRAAKTDFI